jgi:hypothetical protein
MAGLTEYLESVNRQVLKMTESLGASILASQQELIDGLGAQIIQAAPIPLQLPDSVREAMERTAKSMREMWEHTIPPNLAPLDIDVFSDALEISGGSGPCMVWAPRMEIVEELVSAKSFVDRGAILVSRRTEVLDDLEAVLEDAAATAVDAQNTVREFATAAIAAARDGHDATAQALAASTISFVVQEILGHVKFSDARASMSEHDLQQAGIGQVRYLAIERATANPLAPTWEEPEGFNRHGTLHGKPEYYGKAEMLAGLLLLVAWVRELSWWAENDPDIFPGEG